MKNFFTFLAAFLLLHAAAYSQIFPHFAPDTLLQENFQIDPTANMSAAPSGEDLSWVNYDADNLPTACSDGSDPVPQNWFWEIDLNDTTAANNNFAFTSCSYLNVAPPQAKNRNWLILAPIEIPDSSYALCWRSSTFQGPLYMDGYTVLVSETGNLPDDFTDTLFLAAQMTKALIVGDTLVSSYLYSPGYIHANSFTDLRYYFVDLTVGPIGTLVPYFRGKLEPHAIDLKRFAGKTIYIAFLHDSDDDTTLQLDDIVVAKNKTVNSAAFIHDLDNEITVFPNPFRDRFLIKNVNSNLSYKSLIIKDLTGNVVWQKLSLPFNTIEYLIQLNSIENGVYFLEIETEKGIVIKKVFKI